MKFASFVNEYKYVFTFQIKLSFHFFFFEIQQRNGKLENNIFVIKM